MNLTAPHQLSFPIFARFLGLFLIALFLTPLLLLGQEPEKAAQQANDAYVSGSYLLAIKLYSQSIQQNPQDANTYYNRAIAYYHQKAYDEAVADYDQAIALNPNGTNAYYNRGLTCYAKGDFEKAVASYTPYIKHHPQDADGYYNRGIAYYALGNYEKAIADYTEYNTLKSQSPDGYNQLAWLRATCAKPEFRDGKEAVRDATTACELSQWDDPTTVDTLAAANAEAGDFDQAVLRQAQALDAHNLKKSAIPQVKARLDLYRAHRPYRDIK